MILYHGSTIDIAQIDLSKSKPNKDFGHAFYLSLDREQALEMAMFKAAFEETEPVVNAFDLTNRFYRSCGLSVLKTTPRNGRILSTIIEQTLQVSLLMTTTLFMVLLPTIALERR